MLSTDRAHDPDDDSGKEDGRRVPRCSRCGTIGYAGDSYCTRCGASMRSDCPVCGVRIDRPIAFYCPHCGAALLETQGSQRSDASAQQMRGT